MKKTIKFLAVAALAVVLTACGSKDTAKKVDEKVGIDRPVKIGVVGTKSETWDFVIKKLEKEGIKAELVEFTDYNQPNVALLAGDIDLNSFQHQNFLDHFNEDKKSNIVSIGDTVLAPLGIYSNKIKDVSELKEGDKIAIPDDVSNQARAIFLLQTAGLIKVDGKPGDPVTPKNIIENSKNLEIIPMDASQTARALDDVAAACINNGVATDAGYSPSEDAVLLEPVDENSKPFINIIAARAEDKDNEIFKKIVAAYQSDDTEEVIKKESKGSSIAAWK